MAASMIGNLGVAILYLILKQNSQSLIKGLDNNLTLISKTMPILGSRLWGKLEPHVVTAKLGHLQTPATSRLFLGYYATIVTMSEVSLSYKHSMSTELSEAEA